MKKILYCILNLVSLVIIPKTVAQFCDSPKSPPCPPAGAPGAGNPAQCEDRGSACSSTRQQFNGGDCDPIIILGQTGKSGPGPCRPSPNDASYSIYPILQYVFYNQRYEYGKCIYSDSGPDSCCSNKNPSNYLERLEDAQGTATNECLNPVENLPCNEGLLS